MNVMVLGGVVLAALVIALLIPGGVVVAAILLVVAIAWLGVRTYRARSGQV